MFGIRKALAIDDRINWKRRCNGLAYECRDLRLKKFYKAFTVTPDTPLNRVAFLALDLETSGLDSERDQILSIGFITLSWNRIFCDKARHRIIRPDENPKNTQTTIHGITHSRLEGAPGFEETLSPILNAMAGKVMIAHYGRIEREFLNRTTLKLIHEPLIFPMIDTMELESRKHPVFRPNIIQRWMGKKKSPSLRLSHSRERYGLPRYRPHHALTDALATAELFLAQVADQFFPETPVGKLWR
ncbi:3'-5' exonuclease [Desulfocicer niacini]